MKRLRALPLLMILAVLSGPGCGSSPTAPSPRIALSVQVVDEETNRSLTDPVFGIAVQLSAAGAVVYTQPVVDGTATFPDIAEGTYRVTTAVEYAYSQFDVISIVVDGPGTLRLPLKAIDDVTVTEVFVEGQGSIPKGGTVDVPPQGINLHYRGRWQPFKYAWSEYSWFGASLDMRFLSLPFASSRRGPTDWEIVLPGVVPCGPQGSAGCQTNVTASIFQLIVGRTVGFGSLDVLMNKQQRWPLTFRRVP